jgi:DUF3017 family protein
VSRTTAHGAGAGPFRQLWPLLVVAAGVVVGLVLAVVGAGSWWRVGCAVIGASLVLGALLRLLLPGRAAGLLQVRSKAFDVVALALGGGAILALSYWVPGR